MAALQIMADVGKLIPIANNVFQLSQSQLIKDVKDWESNLKNLNKTVSYIKNMLLDMDSKSVLSHEEQGWVEELMEVLYEADDLLDEVITTAKMKELNKGDEFFKKVLDEVSRFFSCMNCILVKYNTSQEVKSIQLKLDAIASNHARYKSNAGPQPHNYEFRIDHQAALKRTTDTSSRLDENIIGRQGDVKVIVDMLLDPNVEENVGFVVIVGIGGLGKTTLARLVYNHRMVGTNTFNKKLWVCISDQDGKGLNVKNILENIIQLSTEQPSNLSTMESIQIKFQEKLEKCKYLLILDDVWTEDPNEWKELSKYLTVGGRGSRIVITTRSEKTADVILGKYAHSKKYMLKGLSDENSWRLFMDTAFELEAEKANDPELIKTGKKIVIKCSNVPLSIKVLGNLLNGQTHKWESFEKNRLPQIETTKNTIMSILKLSYDNLEPSTKNCFRYCALFPKDFEMGKQWLISLWMAQGYIGDSEDDFLILLKRCFFQDVEKDKYGNIVSFKMHDLLHDLAQEVAGDEIIVANSPPNNLSKKLRHLYLDEGEWIQSYFHNRNIRTCYIHERVHSDMVKTLVVNWRCLRSLRLYVPDCEYLSESIGELLHLRCLDLSKNHELKTLPNAIVKLYNLQSLILYECIGFIAWPKYFYKLVNLRLLDVRYCESLTCMPLGLDQLINLVYLPHFIAGGESSIGNQYGGQLKDLKFLVNLRGEINITIGGNLISERQDVWEGGYLEHIKNLNVVQMNFDDWGTILNEAVIAKLQPSRNLMQLTFFGYGGSKIPRWGRAHDDWGTILPNLVKIELCYCMRLDGVPLLCYLKHLKELSLNVLYCIEYMEPSAISHGSSGSKDLLFFPSLEFLKIRDLMSLKGWWGRSGETDSSSGLQHWQPPFPRLSTLIIKMCSKLTSFPPCPSLKSLNVTGCNKSLRILPGEGPANTDLGLMAVADSVGYLTTLPAHRLSSIIILDDEEVKGLSEVEEVFKRCSSLRCLAIRDCRNLTSISGVEHLTALETLSLRNIPALLDDSDDEMPWRSLHHNLRFLEFTFLDNLQILPTWMKHLTALQGLIISRCESLEELPEWISCLSSLHSVKISYCPRLKSVGTIQSITSLRYVDIDCPGLKENRQEDYSDFPFRLFFPRNDESFNSEE